MKLIKFFKVIFEVVLIIIAMCLLYIIGDKSAQTKTKNLSSYTLYYDNNGKECMKNNEFLYKDNEYKYSLVCISSYDTYLVWDDGTKELLKNALENKKVDINSLIRHGLKIDKTSI